jgi:hypothetical protein
MQRACQSVNNVEVRLGRKEAGQPLAFSSKPLYKDMAPY